MDCLVSDLHLIQLNEIQAVVEKQSNKKDILNSLLKCIAL